MKYSIGTKENPMVLKTPPLSSEYTMHVEEKNGVEVLVCTDEKKPAKEGIVEAWDVLRVILLEVGID